MTRVLSTHDTTGTVDQILSPLVIDFQWRAYRESLALIPNIIIRVFIKKLRSFFLQLVTAYFVTFFQIIDNYSGQTRVICGSTLPPLYVSSNNSLSVRLKTDGSGTRGGFRLVYTAGKYCNLLQLQVSVSNNCCGK